MTTARYHHLRRAVPGCPALVAYRLATGRDHRCGVGEIFTIVKALIVAREMS